MADNFINAVKAMHARIAMVASAPDPAAIVQATVNVLHPIVLDIVKKNNVQLARTFRNNPSLLRPGR